MTEGFSLLLSPFSPRLEAVAFISNPRCWDHLVAGAPHWTATSKRHRPEPTCSGVSSAERNSAEQRRVSFGAPCELSNSVSCCMSFVTEHFFSFCPCRGSNQVFVSGICKKHPVYGVMRCVVLQGHVM